MEAGRQKVAKGAKRRRGMEEWRIQGWKVGAEGEGTEGERLGGKEWEAEGKRESETRERNWQGHWKRHQAGTGSMGWGRGSAERGRIRERSSQGKGEEEEKKRERRENSWLGDGGLRKKGQRCTKRVRKREKGREKKEGKEGVKEIRSLIPWVQPHLVGLTPRILLSESNSLLHLPILIGVLPHARGIFFHIFQNNLKNRWSNLVSVKIRTHSYVRHSKKIDFYQNKNFQYVKHLYQLILLLFPNWLLQSSPSLGLHSIMISGLILYSLSFILFPILIAWTVFSVFSWCNFPCFCLSHNGLEFCKGPR